MLKGVILIFLLIFVLNCKAEEVLQEASPVAEVFQKNASFIELVAKGTGEEVHKAFLAGEGNDFDSPAQMLVLLTIGARNSNPSVIKTLLNLKNILAQYGQQQGLEKKSGYDDPLLKNIPLIVAAYANQNSEVVKILLEEGADPNFINEQGNSVLFETCLKNPNPEIISLLIKNGAEVNFKNKSNQTPLMALAEKSNEILPFQILFSAGAEINAKSEAGSIPFVVLVKNTNNPELINLFIQQGALLNQETDTGEIPLVYAILNNPNLPVIQALIQAGAQINYQNKAGISPLMWSAVRNKNKDVISLLLQAGADPELKSGEGFMALDLASQNPNLKETEPYKNLEKATREKIAFQKKEINI